MFLSCITQINFIPAKMKTTLFLSFLTLLNLDIYSSSNFEKREQPNIILILVDDLGKEWISCYGAEDIKTPNIDKLADNGVLFNNVYAMPQCTPTRLALLTGQYPYRNGWINHWDVPRWGGGAHFDETQNPSFISKIKETGYKTCIAGKWQIDDFRVEPDALTKIGFDSYCMWTGYETGIPESAERYQNPYIYSNGFSKTYSNQFGSDIFTKHITSFITENNESPFFVYFPMVLTHPPFVNTPDETSDTKIGKHKAMVRYTDKIVGQLINTLEALNIREETIIIFTTDNGTSRGIKGNYKNEFINGGKTQTTENGICIPFIISWTGRIKNNLLSNALIDFTDILPTCLDIAGGNPKPKMTFLDKSYVIDGISFKDVLTKNRTSSKRSWILSMGGQNNARLTENGVENMYAFRDRVLRNERYKLYINTAGLPEKFFDLEQDPFENQNLINNLNSKERKRNFELLLKPVKTFPKKDNDPVYLNNKPQDWDVKITAKSQVWKSKK